MIGILGRSHDGILNMALKSLSAIFASSSKVKKNTTLTQKSKFVPLFEDMMSSIEPTKELLHSVFELIFNNMDNIDILYPPNTSTVSSILNRSSIADLIIQNSKKEKPGKVKTIPNLASLEFLEVFVYLLSKCGDKDLLYLFWKQFGDNLDSTSHTLYSYLLIDANMDKITESNFIVWTANSLDSHDLTQKQSPKFIEEVLSIIVDTLYYDLNKHVRLYPVLFLNFYRKIPELLKS